MNKIYFILISLGILFGGCSNKTSLLNENEIQQNVMINTKKGQLYNSLEIKATVVATYLNTCVPKFRKSKDEIFLVSIFIDGDSSQKSRQGIYNEDYSLTLNFNKPNSVKILEFSDDLIKLTPIRNRWSNYYLVKFDKESSDDLKMVFKNDAYGEVVLKYQKEY